MNLLNSALLNTNPVSLLPASAGTKATVPTTSFAEVAAVEQVQVAKKQPTEEPLDHGPIEAFKKYMAMSPAEKMFYRVLADEGLTIEQYDQLSPEEKARINDLVEERMRDYREARQLDNSQTQAIAQYQMMQMDKADDGNNHPLTDLFI